MSSIIPVPLITKEHLFTFIKSTGCYRLRVMLKKSCRFNYICANKAVNLRKMTGCSLRSAWQEKVAKLLTSLSSIVACRCRKAAQGREPSASCCAPVTKVSTAVRNSFVKTHTRTILHFNKNHGEQVRKRASTCSFAFGLRPCGSDG